MLIDLTVEVTPKIQEDANALEQSSRFGHLGTHFDIMDKTFPLEYVRRKGVAFDVSGCVDREIEAGDIDENLIEKDMFVAFYSGALDRLGYGTKQYFTEHPQLSHALVDSLLAKGVSIIGVDMAGVRRNPEHKPVDQKCADRMVFVVENIRNLDKVLEGKKAAPFVANTYPINFSGWTGLPCRVVAEI